MAGRSIGLWFLAAWVWQAGCGDADGRPPVAARPDAGGRSDAGHEPEPGDAGMDATVGRGDFPRWPDAEQEIELPYGGPARGIVFTVSASPGALDVHLNVDTSSSIRRAIDELQVALRSTIITRLRARVPDVAFGVSRFSDFPVEPFGYPGSKELAPDRPFVLLSAVTTDAERVTRAVARLDAPLDHGGDIPEASGEALYQIATGAGYRQGSRQLIEPRPEPAANGGESVGGVGFREDALHVVLHVADSPAHTPDEYASGGLPGTRSLATAAAALREIGARVVSIMPTPCTDHECREASQYAATRHELSELALATGAEAAAVGGECPTGIDQASLPAFEGSCPLVFDARADGTGLSRTLSDGVLALLEQVRWGEVRAQVDDDHLGFVRELRVEMVEQAPDVAAPEARDLRPSERPDGVAESYVDVDAEHELGFRVTLKNDRIAPQDSVQRFRIAVEVLGDSVLLARRVFRVVVPAGRQESSGDGALDAAVDPDLDAGH